jgi:hypothetical protein
MGIIMALLTSYVLWVLVNIIIEQAYVWVAESIGGAQSMDSIKQ